MIKIMNWFIMPLILAIANPVAVNSLSKTYDTFTFDVSDSAATKSTEFRTGGPEIVENTFSNYSPLEFTNFNPRTLSEVSRTDDAIIKISIIELWEGWTEEVIYSQLVNFNPFTLINFNNIDVINCSCDDIIAENIRFSAQQIKDNIIGVTNTIYFDNKADLKIAFNVYVAAFWFQVKSGVIYLFLPMLAEFIVGQASWPENDLYRVTISLKLGSVIRFS